MIGFLLSVMGRDDAGRRSRGAGLPRVVAVLAREGTRPGDCPAFLRASQWVNRKSPILLRRFLAGSFTSVGGCRWASRNFARGLVAAEKRQPDVARRAALAVGADARRARLSAGARGAGGQTGDAGLRGRVADGRGLT